MKPRSASECNAYDGLGRSFRDGVEEGKSVPSAYEDLRLSTMK